MFNFSLGLFCAFPIFADLVHVVSRQRAIGERNGPSFGPQGYAFSVYRVRLTVKCSVLVGVIRCIPDFRRPCTCYVSETANFRVKRPKCGLQG